MSTADATEKTPFTVVTCIESGGLETEVPLMVASLRRFGGRFADCPVIAASPRKVGLPLLASTRKKLDDLGVELIERDVRHRYRWWGFMNKPTSLLLAAPRIKTRDAVWLDGDTLIAQPPEELARHPEAQFVAAVEDQGPVSTGPDSPFEAYWARMARTIGLTVDQLPWVSKPHDGTRIRIYFNSGVVRYRTGIGFEERYIKTFEELLDARFVPRLDPSIFLLEQISMSLTVPRHEMTFHELDYHYNFHTEEGYEKFCPPSEYPNVAIFHYHRGLRTGYRARMLELLRGPFPELAALVESAEPPPSGGLAKLRTIPRRLLYEVRKKRTVWFNDRCTRV